MGRRSVPHASQRVPRRIFDAGVAIPRPPVLTIDDYLRAMDDTTAELNELFASSAPDGLPKDVLSELQSILRVQSISPQELFFKWESYCLKMGAEETKLNLDTVRLFKRDVQESLERESRGRAGRQAEKRSAVTATPRAGMTSDMFGM